MKRCAIALAAILLLLCGCSETPQDTTPPVTTVQPTIQTDPGRYLPESDLEQITSGAVRMYAGEPGEDCRLLQLWGADLLWITEGEQVQISRLSGENCVRTYHNTLQVQIDGLWILDNEIAFYDQISRSVIYMDGMLKEIKRVELPEDISGNPVLSKDLKTIYYCVATELRGLDTQTGISRLIRQITCKQQSAVKLLFDESLLLCDVVLADGTRIGQFVSPESGETVEQLENSVEMNTLGQNYFANYRESICGELLFGVKGEAAQALRLPEDVYGAPLLNIHSYIALDATEEGTVLDLYDLEKGTRTASVLLPGYVDASNFVADPQTGVIWFTVRDGEQEWLCRWEFGKTPAEDTAVYTGLRFTEEAPDAEGLEAGKQRAKEISRKYGFTLLLDDQLPCPEGYDFGYEYQVPALEKALAQLERLLPQFPEELIPALEDGGLRIGLVRSIDGLTEDAVPDSNGLQYFVQGEACIALVIQEDMQDAFYHQLYHVLDTYVYANSVLLDDWDSLNPKGFAYDGNYSDYEKRTDGAYLQGDSRAFVSEFSKTFSTDDRATLFAAAMTEGNEAMFASDIMQKKLQKLCSGIREAYAWKKDERSFLWEQYLKLPFAFQFKY